MDSIGKRIARHRILKGWSRPELGRVMAEKIGRAKPYTGETIRRYEIEKDNPGDEPRKALSHALGVSEQYIEFGDPPSKEKLPSNMQDFWGAFLSASADDRRLITAILSKTIKKRK